jgi:hypothetical protein
MWGGGARRCSLAGTQISSDAHSGNCCILYETEMDRSTEGGRGTNTNTDEHTMIIILHNEYMYFSDIVKKQPHIIFLVIRH